MRGFSPKTGVSIWPNKSCPELPWSPKTTRRVRRIDRPCWRCPHCRLLEEMNHALGAGYNGDVYIRAGQAHWIALPGCNLSPSERASSTDHALQRSSLLPLIIQTDTLAVMDTPTREAPKIQRDDCLPRIRCFMNKKKLPFDEWKLCNS